MFPTSYARTYIHAHVRRVCAHDRYDSDLVIIAVPVVVVVIILIVVVRHQICQTGSWWLPRVAVSYRLPLLCASDRRPIHDPIVEMRSTIVQRYARARARADSSREESPLMFANYN